MNNKINSVALSNLITDIKMQLIYWIQTGYNRHSGNKSDSFKL